MPYTIKTWKEALNGQATAQAYGAFSTEEFFLQQAAQAALAVLCQREEPEVTRIDGPAPDLDALVTAAGTISFFSGRRVVFLDKLELTAMQDAQVKELCEIMQSAENAVFVLTVLFRDEKAKSTKKAKLLTDTIAKIGVAAEFTRPQPKDLRAFVTGRAKEYGAVLPAAAADAMLERCGNDLYLLENEVAKLAALSGYSEITEDMIRAVSTRNVEADVFEMIRFVTAKNPAKAFETLHELFYLQNEPIAIAAALSSSFIDMYRVKAASAEGYSYQKAFRDMGYKGNDYRLKRSAQTASAYSLTQLEQAVLWLEKLDLKLKSSPVSQTVLLEAALGQLCTLGRSR